MPPRSVATTLRTLWSRLSPLPGGRWLFSRLFGRAVPYTGTVHPLVVAFEPGHVRMRIRDRRRLRNHLGSIHAVALANLGEATSGLALIGALPADVRGIVTGIDVAFHKKARGTLEAEAVVQVPRVTETMDYHVQAHVRDAAGDEVATVTVRWRLGPVPSDPRTP